MSCCVILLIGLSANSEASCSMYLRYSCSVLEVRGLPCLFLLDSLNSSATSRKVVPPFRAEACSGSIHVPVSIEISICRKALSARLIVENVPPDRLMPFGSVYRIRIRPDLSRVIPGLSLLA